MSTNETVKKTTPIIFFILLVLVLAYLGVAKLKHETQNGLREGLQTVLVAVQESHHLVLEQRKRALKTLINSPNFQALTNRILADPVSSQEAQKQLKAELITTINNFKDQGYFLIDKQLNIVSSYSKNQASIRSDVFSHHPHFMQKVFQGQTTFVPPIELKANQTDVINTAKESSAIIAKFVITPVLDDNGEVQGAIAFQLDPSSYFSSIPRLGRIGESGETYAFNKEGLLLTESRFRHHLLKANLINLDEYGVYTLRITDPGGNLIAGYKPKVSKDKQPLTLMAANATAGIDGYNMDGYRDYRGVTVVGAWVWLDEFDIGLAIEIDIDEALHSYYQTRNALIAIVFVIVLASIFMVRQIFRTHKNHQNHMENINTELELRVEKRTEELVKAQQELSRANEELTQKATTDGLTAIANRRHFDECYKNEWQRNLRSGGSISIIMIDLDYFKNYNDCYGHGRGDHCLITIANALVNAQIAQRPGDLFARYGGEEFIVLLSNASTDYTKDISHQIREIIKSLHIPHRENKASKNASVTASIGFACQKINATLLPQTLLDFADQALYRAKDLGRDQVVDYASISSANISSLKRS